VKFKDVKYRPIHGLSVQSPADFFYFQMFCCTS